MQLGLSLCRICFLAVLLRTVSSKCFGREEDQGISLSGPGWGSYNEKVYKAVDVKSCKEIGRKILERVSLRLTATSEL